jgi:hypothetical protein
MTCVLDSQLRRRAGKLYVLEKEHRLATGVSVTSFTVHLDCSGSCVFVNVDGFTSPSSEINRIPRLECFATHRQQSAARAQLPFSLDASLGKQVVGLEFWRNRLGAFGFCYHKVSQQFLYPTNQQQTWTKHWTTSVQIYASGPIAAGKAPMEQHVYKTKLISEDQLAGFQNVN